MRKSVILCTYNGEKYIKEQIESILNQSVMVDEIIISDDFSNDNTIDIIKKIFMESDVDIKININNDNLGFKKNFYNAMKLCSGDVIFFSDQDDVWMNNKVEKIMNTFEKNTSALLVFSNAEVTDQNLNLNSYLLDDVYFDDSIMENSLTQLKFLLADNFITGATMAIKRDLIEKAMPFGMEWPHDYWLGVVAAMNNGLYVIKDPLIKYRQHTDNAIGINQRININLLKKMFSKERTATNRDNQYAELRLPLLSYLMKFIDEKKLGNDYLNIVKDNYNFWKKREKFKENSAFNNCKIVIKDIKTQEQKKFRNTDKPILKDFLKAIALSKR